MTERKCSSCKYFEPAPIWRKGWCRNPLLYSPDQNHLVGEDDLDCERGGMVDFWEPANASDQLPIIPLQDILQTSNQSTSGGGNPYHAPTSNQPRQRAVYPVTGSSGYPPDDDDDDYVYDDEMDVQERQYDTYGDPPRYWTDYLRIALPVLGVLLILLLALWWLIPMLRGDDSNGTTASGTVTTTIPVIQATTTGGTGQTGTPQISTTQVPGIVPTATTAPTQPVDSNVIHDGATVEVTNTGGTGVNMRSSPSTDGDIVNVVLDGTQMTVTGPSEQADGFTWWPVEGAAGSGYIVADYLKVAN